MFTVKFMTFFEDGGCMCHSFACSHYSAYIRHDKTVSVTVYADLTDTSGIERHISDEESHFDACYVENSKGKTIDSFRPPEAQLQAVGEGVSGN